MGKINKNIPRTTHFTSSSVGPHHTQETDCRMLSKITVLLLLLITTISCELNRDKRGRRKNVNYPDKSLWKKEYEDELSDAMLSTRKRENHTRVPQSSTLSDNEAVIEKLMETITSSEKYFKKIDSIDFRLNRLDIEVHEKTNSIIKQLTAITKSVGGDSGCSEKMTRGLETVQTDMNYIKMILDKNTSLRSSIRGIISMTILISLNFFSCNTNTTNKRYQVYVSAKYTY